MFEGYRHLYWESETAGDKYCSLHVPDDAKTGSIKDVENPSVRDFISAPGICEKCLTAFLYTETVERSSRFM